MCCLPLLLRVGRNCVSCNIYAACDPLVPMRSPRTLLLFTWTYRASSPPRPTGGVLEKRGEERPDSRRTPPGKDALLSPTLASQISLEAGRACACARTGKRIVSFAAFSDLTAAVRRGHPAPISLLYFGSGAQEGRMGSSEPR